MLLKLFKEKKNKKNNETTTEAGGLGKSQLKWKTIYLISAYVVL